MQNRNFNGNKSKNMSFVDQRYKNAIHSPECSAVQRNITNQSHQMSWLQKLVAADNCQPEYEKQLYVNSCNNKIKYSQNQEILTQRNKNIDNNIDYYRSQQPQQRTKNKEKYKINKYKSNQQNQTTKGNKKGNFIFQSKIKINHGIELNDSAGRIRRNQKSKQEKIIQAIQSKYERQRKKIYGKNTLQYNTVNINKINNIKQQKQKHLKLTNYKSQIQTPKKKLYGSRRNSCNFRQEINKIQNINMKLNQALCTDLFDKKDKQNNHQLINDVSYEQNNPNNNNMLTFNNIAVDPSNNTNSLSLSQKIQNLFVLLDHNKSGLLSKSNCNCKILPEDLKIVLGNVISQIKFKSIKMSKKTFVVQCLKILEQFQKSQLEHLFSQIQKLWFKKSCQNKLSQKQEQKLLNKYTWKNQEINNYNTLKNKQIKSINKEVYMDQESLIMSRLISSSEKSPKSINLKHNFRAYQSKQEQKCNTKKKYPIKDYNYQRIVPNKQKSNIMKLSFTQLTKHI